MNISQAEQLKLLNELLLGFSPIFLTVFILGIVTGVFFFTDLVNRLDRLSERFRRPRRIKRSADFGEHGDFEYLYLFQGRYYSLGEYEDLRAKVRNKFFIKHDAHVRTAYRHFFPIQSFLLLIFSVFTLGFILCFAWVYSNPFH